MKKRSVATGLAVLLLLVLASTAFAAPAGASVPLPFKGTIESVEHIEFVPPVTLLIDATGSGNATHLGRYTVTYHIEVDNSDPNVGVSVGSLTFVAANGDSISADGTGEGKPTVIPGVNRIVEEYTITGGTGRFAGATGNFTMERLVTLGSGYSSGDFDGQIVIP
jgi:acyl-coenzyme A thioesterase PaaI-like protein